jgi:hypothetical protein
MEEDDDDLPPKVQKNIRRGFRQGSRRVVVCVFGGGMEPLVRCVDPAAD